MAVRTKTVTYHSCDLCGTDCDDGDLARLYGPQRAAGKRAQIDICLTCTQRPVADVIEWIRHREQETALRPLRSLKGVGRT